MRNQISTRGTLATVLAVLGVLGWPSSESLLQAGQATPAAQAGDNELKIVVIEGEDGVNIIKKKSAVQPVVEVRDKNDLPLAGVTVLFTLPSSGPSAVFANGAKTLTLVTNASGRAAAASLHPVGTGSFNIGVSASFQGHVATTAISQTNYLTAAAASAAGAPGTGAAGGGASMSTGMLVAIVAGVAAIAGVGLAVGLKGSTQPPPPPAATTISLGGSTVAH